jgi:hypothetical protein
MKPSAESPQTPPKNTRLGAIAGAIMLFFTRKPPKNTPENLKKHEFSTSTQRKGIRFNEKIRDIFRGRWIKKH